MRWGGKNKTQRFRFSLFKSATQNAARPRVRTSRTARRKLRRYGIIALASACNRVNVDGHADGHAFLAQWHCSGGRGACPTIVPSLLVYH